MLLAGMFLCGCKRDKDVDCPEGYIQVGDHCEEEQEIITSVILHLTLDTTHISYSYKDVDGIGGNPPVIDTIKLLPDTTYTVELEILDESKNPVDDITAEIRSRKEEHQFFYNTDGSLQLNVTYNDQDDNGYPVGLSTSFVCSTASNGNLEVVLKHQPGTKDGNQTTGATDVDATFPVVIKKW